MSELRPGTEFAGYRIERVLGEGGMGIVYEATEVALDRRIALKLIADDATRDPLFRDRFSHESRIAAQVEHPNVVPVYAVGEEDGTAFMAMRLIGGPDLGRKITELRRLEPEDAAGLIAQVASGLDAIHTAGLVHRDVKPSNILLGGEEGREHAYITDFGLAKQIATTTDLSSTGQIVGTLDYLSPEQIEHRGVDAATDVYALGCVLYKALTGSAPYVRDTDASVMWAHVHSDPPKPSETAGVPPALDPVVARAMAKRSEDRFLSAGDLGRAAVAAASGRPVTEPERRVAQGAAERPGLMLENREGSTGDLARRYSDNEPTPRLEPKPPPRFRRLRALTPLLLGLAAGAVIGIAVFFITGRHKDSQPPQAELISRADAICAASRALFNQAARSEPSTTAEAEARTAKLMRISEDALRKLRRIEAPPEVAKEWREYLGLRAVQVELLRSARDAAERGDIKAYNAALHRIDRSVGVRASAAADVGLMQCSRG